MAVTITSGDTINVTVTQSASSSVTITSKGPKGDTGETGATGATGSTGAAGAAGKTYTISCVDGDNSDEEKIRLTDSDGTTDDVVLEAGTGMSIARSGDKITLTNTVTDTNTQLTTEQVQDIVGAMLTGNTETRISVTYDDTDGTIDFAVDDMTADTNTQLSTEEVQDIVGGMFTGNTETGISATYEDSDGTIDLVVSGGGFKMLQNYSYSDTGTSDKFFVQTDVTELSGSNAARDFRSAFAIPIAGSIHAATMMGASGMSGVTYRLIVHINNTATYFADAVGGNEVGSRLTCRWTAWKNSSDSSDASDPSYSANDYLAFQLIPQDTGSGRPANPGSVSLAVVTSHT